MSQSRPEGQGREAEPWRRSVPDWLARLGSHGEVGALLRSPEAEQEARGYRNTLREILHQPVTWLETAAGLASRRSTLDKALQAAGIPEGKGAIVFTGSGSSVYAGECVAPSLQKALRVPVLALPAGLLLTHPQSCLPPSGPYLVVSLARSGNSPESRAVVESLLADDPRGRHLVITCNRDGALVTGFASNPRVDALVLDEKTEDRSLVMTSSFTNLVVAGLALGAGAPADFTSRIECVARAGAHLLLHRADALAGLSGRGIRSVVYLGSGPRLGSAHEAALKMLEMTAGRVPTLADSFLGVRHGPLSFVHMDTLVVAFLSSDEVVRAYEVDLLAELDRKGLGAGKLIVGSGVPAALATRAADLVIDYGAALPDADLVVLDAVVGQLLSFFRCLREGLPPDSPSREGVISRVVESFAIHRRP